MTFNVQSERPLQCLLLRDHFSLSKVPLIDENVDSSFLFSGAIIFLKRYSLFFSISLFHILINYSIILPSARASPHLFPCSLCHFFNLFHSITIIIKHMLSPCKSPPLFCINSLKCMFDSIRKN